MVSMKRGRSRSADRDLRRLGWGEDEGLFSAPTWVLDRSTRKVGAPSFPGSWKDPRGVLGSGEGTGIRKVDPTPNRRESYGWNVGDYVMPLLGSMLSPPGRSVREPGNPTRNPDRECHVAPVRSDSVRSPRRTMRHVSGGCSTLADRTVAIVPDAPAIGTDGASLADPRPEPGPAVRCTRHVRLRRAGDLGGRWCGLGRKAMATPRTWWNACLHVRSEKKPFETPVPWE